MSSNSGAPAIGGMSGVGNSRSPYVPPDTQFGAQNVGSASFSFPMPQSFGIPAPLQVPQPAGHQFHCFVTPSIPSVVTTSFSTSVAGRSSPVVTSSRAVHSMSSKDPICFPQVVFSTPAPSVTQGATSFPQLAHSTKFILPSTADVPVYPVSFQQATASHPSVEFSRAHISSIPVSRATAYSLASGIDSSTFPAVPGPSGVHSSGGVFRTLLEEGEVEEEVGREEPEPPRLPTPLLDPVSPNPDPGTGEAGFDEDFTASSDFSFLLYKLKELFPMEFGSTPQVEPSCLAEALRGDIGDSSGSLKTEFPWSATMRILFQKANEVLAADASAPKSQAVFSPQFLSARRRRCYKVSELPKLKTSHDASNIMRLIDAPRRKQVTAVRSSWSQKELLAGLHSCFKALEMISFMDWALGAALMMLRSLVNKPSVSKSDLSFPIRILTVAGRAVHDLGGETSSMYANFMTKKRDSFCKLFSASVSDHQKSSLIHSEINESSLFDSQLVASIADNLDKIVQSDFMKRPAPAASLPPPKYSRFSVPPSGNTVGRSLRGFAPRPFLTRGNRRGVRRSGRGGSSAANRK